MTSEISILHSLIISGTSYHLIVVNSVVNSNWSADGRVVVYFVIFLLQAYKCIVVGDGISISL